MAQLVKRLTLGFGSGYDLTVHEFEPCVGLLTVSKKPALDFSLPLVLSRPCSPACTVSLWGSLARARALSLSLSK